MIQAKPQKLCRLERLVLGYGGHHAEFQLGVVRPDERVPGAGDVHVPQRFQLRWPEN